MKGFYSAAKAYNPLRALALRLHITLPIPSGVKDKEFWILHQHDDGTIETITPINNGDGTCIFTVGRFSTFVLVNAAEPIIQPTTPPEQQPIAYLTPEVPTAIIAASPQTGDSSNMFGWIVILTATVVICAVILIVLKKKQKIEE